MRWTDCSTRGASMKRPVPDTPCLLQCFLSLTSWIQLGINPNPTDALYAAQSTWLRCTFVQLRPFCLHQASRCCSCWTWDAEISCCQRTWSHTSSALLPHYHPRNIRPGLHQHHLAPLTWSNCKYVHFFNWVISMAWLMGCCFSVSKRMNHVRASTSPSCSTICANC